MARSKGKYPKCVKYGDYCSAYEEIYGAARKVKNSHFVLAAVKFMHYINDNLDAISREPRCWY
jgi:hypothetical protein